MAIKFRNPITKKFVEIPIPNISDSDVENWNNKQDQLTSSQQAAVNSGITKDKVDAIPTSQNITDIVHDIVKEYVKRPTGYGTAQTLALNVAITASEDGIVVMNSSAGSSNSAGYAYVQIDGLQFSNSNYGTTYAWANNKVVPVFKGQTIKLAALSNASAQYVPYKYN